MNRLTNRWILLASVLLLNACAGQSAATPTAQPPLVQATATVAAIQPTGTASQPTAALAPSATVPPTLAPGMFVNPVFDQDFPDPDVLKVGDTYYAYATNSNGTNIQVASSQDLVNWRWIGDALPNLPAWASSDFGNVWAPDVSQPQGGNSYLMYFVAHYKIGAGGMQCIGAATSDKPEGPFKPLGNKPFICQTDEGGSIDPASFVDEDRKRYVLWKNDGNSVGGVSWLYIQSVSADGLTLEGSPKHLIKAERAWEGVLVEAPTLWKHGGKYYLFYSANAYNTPRYAVGWAVSSAVFGPYKRADEPLLQTSIPAGIVGPGGQDIVVGPKGSDWVVFHGWAGEAYRRLYLAPLTWEGDTPVVKINDRQPVPLP